MKETNHPYTEVLFSYVEKYKPTLHSLTWIILIGTALLLVLAWLVMKYVDDPIRKWLSR